MEAQRRVPALVAAQGARLIEFVTVTPSLEDVFMRLVGAETEDPLVSPSAAPVGDTSDPAGGAT